MERNPENPDRESLTTGAKGTYGQHDQSPAAGRNRSRKDQHYPAQAKPGNQGADSFGEGGFAAGGYGQSGYGGEYGQLQPSQRHEGSVEQARGDDDAGPGGVEGTASEPSR